MKKIFLLFAILALLLTAGCETVDPDNGGNNLNGGLLEDDLVTIMAFENYSELQTIRGWSNMLGKASVNTDTNYITQGNASMRVDVYGDYTSVNAYPYFIIDCESTSVSTNDFSIFEYIALDVYNDTDETLHIKMHISAKGYSGKSEHTNAVVVELAPRQWTRATYDLEDGSVRKSFNDLQEVDGVVVQFLEYRTSKNDSPNTFYIDNLAGKEDSDPDIYNPSRETSELLFFESDGDVNFFDTYGLCLNMFYNADLSINTDSIFVSQGTKSMKCVFKYRYIYFDYYVQSKDLWIPLGLNIQTLGNCKTIWFDIFNGSGGTRQIKVKYSYTASGSSGSNTQTYTLTNGEMRTIQVTVSGANPRITDLEIQSKPEYTGDDVYYIDNIRGFN